MAYSIQACMSPVSKSGISSKIFSKVILIAQECEYIRHSDSHASHTRPLATLLRVKSNSVQRCHTFDVYSKLARSLDWLFNSHKNNKKSGSLSKDGSRFQNREVVNRAIECIPNALPEMVRTYTDAHF